MTRDKPPVDTSFAADAQGLAHALDLLTGAVSVSGAAPLGDRLPDTGLGERAALDMLAPLVLGQAAQLDDPLAFAHMDPPTPWITWATAQWNARLNQNLLHPATAPFAREAEARVISWLASAFGMGGGHMTAGGTLANLTALWAARDAGDVRRVVASDAAHLSIAKAAHILGLPITVVPADGAQRLDAGQLGDLSDACLVLTAGTTSAGAVDPLTLDTGAAWTHVDAAWAGPLRFSDLHSQRLTGIDRADSVTVSGHKWLFQPKESALILFREAKRAQQAISFGGSYLAQPNVGLQGSHGAMAVPLLATLLAWGRSGLAERIDLCMSAADTVYDALKNRADIVTFGPPQTGVLLFRPKVGTAAALHSRLPNGLASLTNVRGVDWLRCVAANPVVDVQQVVDAIIDALDRGGV